MLPVRTSALLQRKQMKTSEGKPLTKMFKTESEISKYLEKKKSHSWKNDSAVLTEQETMGHK